MSVSEAAHCGDVQAVKMLLLDQGQKVDDERDSDGWTALHFATDVGHVEIVEMLLAHSPELLGVVDKNGWSCLHMAAKAGFDKLVEMFLARRPSLIEARDASVATALHVAARMGHTRVVELLLVTIHHSFPSLISAVDDRKLNALHIAAMHGHARVAELLIEASDELIEAVDPNGWHALHLASCYGRSQVVNVLLRPSINEKNCQYNQNKNNTSAVLCIGGAKNDETKEEDAAEEDEQRPQKKLCKLSSHQQHETEREKEKEKEKEEAQAVVEQQSSSRVARILNQAIDYSRRNSLHIAAVEGFEEVGGILLAHMPSLAQAADSAGDTPLHLAAEKCSVEFVTKMWEIDPTMLVKYNAKRETPFIRALKGDNQSVVKFFQPKLSLGQLLFFYLRTVLLLGDDALRDLRDEQLLLGDVYALREEHIEQPLASFLHAVTINLVCGYLDVPEP